MMAAMFVADKISPIILCSSHNFSLHDRATGSSERTRSTLQPVSKCVIMKPLRPAVCR